MFDIAHSINVRHNKYDSGFISAVRSWLYYHAGSVYWLRNDLIDRGAQSFEVHRDRYPFRDYVRFLKRGHSSDNLRDSYIGILEFDQADLGADPSNAILDYIAIADKFQNKGIGSNLLAHVGFCADLYGKHLLLFPGVLSREFINVSPISKRILRRWYKHHGFLPSRERAGYLCRRPSSANIAVLDKQSFQRFSVLLRVSCAVSSSC